MTFGTKTEKKEIAVEFFGNEFVFSADENTLNACNEIKAEAKFKLAAIKNGELQNDEVLADVEAFLKQGIQRLAGDDAVQLWENVEVMTVPDYTEILCRCISEIGFAFESELRKGHDGNVG